MGKPEWFSYASLMNMVDACCQRAGQSSWKSASPDHRGWSPHPGPPQQCRIYGYTGDLNLLLRNMVLQSQVPGMMGWNEDQFSAIIKPHTVDAG